MHSRIFIFFTIFMTALDLSIWVGYVKCDKPELVQKLSVNQFFFLSNGKLSVFCGTQKRKHFEGCYKIKVYCKCSKSVYSNFVSGRDRNLQKIYSVCRCVVYFFMFGWVANQQYIILPFLSTFPIQSEWVFANECYWLFGKLWSWDPGEVKKQNKNNFNTSHPVWFSIYNGSISPLILMKLGRGGALKFMMPGV